MYGEDSCGRKVSLLNDSQSTAATTTYHITTSFTRPDLPTRSRPSTSSISSCASREGYNSSRSSFSASPRHSHSPPTPSLVRLDSRSSLRSRSTPSPMTPQYGFEPMDQHMKREQGQPPYYNQFNQRSNGYPAIQDPTPQPYYNLSSQQALPRMSDFTMDDDATFQPQQPQQPTGYKTKIDRMFYNQYLNQHK